MSVIRILTGVGAHYCGSLWREVLVQSHRKLICDLGDWNVHTERNISISLVQTSLCSMCSKTLQV